MSRTRSAASRVPILALGVALVGCGDAPSNAGGAAATLTSSATTSEASATTTALFSASGSGESGTGAAAGGGPWSNPVLSHIDFTCKLISDATIDDPTDNRTQTRFNLRGTDLGVPAIAGDRLYLFFGDTVGYREIWDFGEDPDSVARLSLDVVRADPSSVCRELDFYVTPDDPSVAADVDPTILRDFAGASMAPPSGEAIAGYVAQPAGPFPNLPGTFEVPSGAIDDGQGGVFVFYAGRVETAPRTRATLGYLARWASPTTTGPDYQIVRRVDSLDVRELGGHFIQIAPVRKDGRLYLYGTGDYRRSGVYLARVDPASLVAGGSDELYDPDTATYRAASALSADARASTRPLFEEDGVGELSVTYLPEAGLFVAVYQRELHDAGGNLVDNRVVLRTANDPEGPFSDAVTLIDMADPAFRAAHCCSDTTTCTDAELLHCDRAGLYGAYALPVIQAEVQGALWLSLRIPILVSTWDPYNVVLFSAGVDLIHEMGR